MRVFLVNLLKASGYEAAGIGNRIEGMNMARNLSPSLIILDITMPGDEGIQLYRGLKQDRELSRVPVILLSGLDRDLFFHYLTFPCRQTGQDLPHPDAYLEKPPESEILVKLIHDLIHEREPS
jgi:CheY-like chemotaxis protein